MRAWLLAALVACGSHLFTPSACAQGPLPLPPIKVSVDLVTLDAQVLAAKTRQPVSDLRPGELELYEDGVRQSLTSFTHDEAPLSIVILFDLTDSVRPVLKSLAAGAGQALTHLKPEDEVAVMTYSDTAAVIQPFTRDRAAAAAAIARAAKMESDEAAFFNEGLYQAALQFAAPQFAASPPGAGDAGLAPRRVIIWLTDNVPNAPSPEIRFRYARDLRGHAPHTQAEALRALLAANVAVFTLRKSSDISDAAAPISPVDQMLYPPGDVYHYAGETGGWVQEHSGRNALPRFISLLDDVRMRYTLAYRPSRARKPGSYHKIEIKAADALKLRAGKVIITARHGYYR